MSSPHKHTPLPSLPLFLPPFKHTYIRVQIRHLHIHLRLNLNTMPQQILGGHHQIRALLFPSSGRRVRHQRMTNQCLDSCLTIVHPRCERISYQKPNEIELGGGGGLGLLADDAHREGRNVVASPRLLFGFLLCVCVCVCVWERRGRKVGEMCVTVVIAVECLVGYPKGVPSHHGQPPQDPKSRNTLHLLLLSSWKGREGGRELLSRLHYQLTSEEMTKSLGRYWGNFSKKARMKA